METTPNLERAAGLLNTRVVKAATPEPNRLDVYIEPANLWAAVNTLVQAKFGYFSALTGLDVPPTEAAEGQVEALYHFCEGADVLTLRVSVPYVKPELDSICDIIPAATLYEREFMEMFGVTLRGTPNTDRLLLADDWPDGLYPMRKSFTGFGINPDQAGTGGAERSGQEG